MGTPFTAETQRAQKHWLTGQAILRCVFSGLYSQRPLRLCGEMF
jgi:hypothetical protein